MHGGVTFPVALLAVPVQPAASGAAAATRTAAGTVAADTLILKAGVAVVRGWAAAG